MNILYLHGLNSKISSEKRKILNYYGTVFAPEINYEYQHTQPIGILKQFPNTEFNVVIGSSMGALNAYIISENIGRPALMFNPPLSKYKQHNFKPKFSKIIVYQHFRLGGDDDIVNPSATLKFLSDRIADYEFQVFTDPQLGHRIPLDIFSKDVKNFFSNLCY